MSLAFNTSQPLSPGAIVYAPFPYEEKDEAKDRPVFIVRIESKTFLARGIYTKRGRSRRPIPRSRQNGLREDSFLGEQLARIRTNHIRRFLGDTDPYFDPYDDFAA